MKHFHFTVTRGFLPFLLFLLPTVSAFSQGGTSARLDSLQAEMKQLDDDVERRVAKLVQLLASMRDSEESRGRISRAKEEAIAGLAGPASMFARPMRSQLPTSWMPGDAFPT